MSLFGGNKSMKQDSSKGGTPKWLKNGEKILDEFGECSTSIGKEASENVGIVKTTNRVSFGQVVITNKRILFFKKSGLFGGSDDEELGDTATKPSNFAYLATEPNKEGFQLWFDMAEIKKRISESRPADGRKLKPDFVPVTLVTGVNWVEKGVFGKQQIGLHVLPFIPALMEQIKENSAKKEEYGKRKSLFWKMETKLAGSQRDLLDKMAFGGFILFIKFEGQDMKSLNKFVQLLSDKVTAVANYRSNEALILKDYFH
jgi:hypothetical protein